MRLVASRSLVRFVTTISLVVTLTLGNLLVTSVAHAQRIKPHFWGMNDPDWTSPPDVPVGAANFTVNGTYWWLVETSPGVYDFTRLTTQAAKATQAGAKPMLVMGGTPWFHSTDEEGSGDRTDMPRIEAWKDYVRAVVTEFGYRFDYQIWPEPNNPSNWSDSPRAMAKLTVVAAKIINDVAPSAKVVSPSVVLRLESQRKWTLAYFKQEVGGRRVHTYLDAIAINPFPEEAGTPEDSFDIMMGIRKRLARIGVRRPFWNNEINYGVVSGGGGPTTMTYSVDKQQSYVIRTYVLSAAAKMQRTYWLGWFSNNTLAVTMADSSGETLPPGESYAVVRSWLNNTTFRGCEQTRGLWMCTARKGKETRQIYWKPKGKATIRTPRSTLRVEDQEGGVDSRRVSRKRIRVDYRPVMVASKR